MLIKSATDMSGIITRELTMGIISLALIFVSIAAVLLYFKQQLKDRKKDCHESFVSLRIALDCRHQAVRHVLDAYSKHLHEQGIASDQHVQQMCAEVETALAQTAKTFSESKIKRLCEAETALNHALKKLQTAVNGLLKQYPDEKLAGLMEMLDAAEAEVVSARRTYNRRAGSYNHHLNKLPNRLVAKPLGFDKQARLVRFTENQTQQMSSNMLA